MTLLQKRLQHYISAAQAKIIAQQIEKNQQSFSPEQCWQFAQQEILTKQLPFEVHEILYQTIYTSFKDMPAPAWFPSTQQLTSSNIAKIMQKLDIHDYQTFHQWSYREFKLFWQQMIDTLQIQFDRPYKKIAKVTNNAESVTWFPPAKLNIINSCFNAKDDATAIISQNPQGEIIRTSYADLNKLSNQIANSIQQFFSLRDRIAIIMPMTLQAVAIYLGIIKAGCTVVAIADSFSAEEIAIRLKIANTKGIFCQDNILRDSKCISLYTRIQQANAPLTIVIPADTNLTIELNKYDMSWEKFLSPNTNFQTISCNPNDAINILFSSGTTGDPKAIPWDHTSPIKCASDAYLHHNVQPGDIFCWPSNLGWMMGPWQIFAALINQATLAIFSDSPTQHTFGRFIQDTKVTHLGIVPTIVKSWRNSRCMQDIDLGAIKLFTSTGERSNPEDMLYLMYLADYVPIIEYCGGTEISGAYITSTMIQPSAPSAFTTAALGLDFMIIDEHGKPSDTGEVAIIPPSIGLSTTLINKNHHHVYYENMPYYQEKILRRHGDQIKHYTNGYYRLLGRVDDTMKLSGIKISSAEIEAVLNVLPEINETAAIAVNPANGGPSLLVVYVVLKISMDPLLLQQKMQILIKQNLNALFKIHDVVIIESLPRTASNKVMRRVLRDQYSER